MLKTVCFVSRTTFENHMKLSSARKYVAISITDPSAKPARAPGGLSGLLRLAFEDEFEEGLGVAVGGLPDLHERHQEGVRLFFDNLELCDASDAAKIFRLLQHHAIGVEDVDLIVHCNAGISRSAAVAKFASDHFGCQIVQGERDTSGANSRLTRLLRAHAEGLVPSVGKIARQRPDYAPDTPLCVVINGVSSVIPVEPLTTQQIMMSGASW
jgi:predicted protein tyrosine phosphatase